MALPAVHRCLQLSDENEQLIKKLKKLHIKNKDLEKNLGQIQQKLHLQQLMRDYVMSRELLEMYNDLHKRYVKEIKTNQEQSETIKNLTIKVCELEKNLQEQRQRIEQLECKKVSWKTSAVSGKRSRTPVGEVTSHTEMSKKKESCCSEYLELLLKEMKKLKKKNVKLSTERRALKCELAGLDKDFFEEIEDLKHAVQESVKLNNQYEKCLKQISVMYGLPFTVHL
ncbi:cancer-associated gene 1 protein-like isoform X2 [Phaenicophaeus curvirostris]|uniref:cancer-associated gene 1 protein-like isoform X2 n=1 Tax=Phaenicophaeus curvirostris TaxID=33595 RepID=UPI0037F0D183